MEPDRIINSTTFHSARTMPKTYVTICILLLFTIGCAPKSLTHQEREVENEEDKLLRELREQADARTARLRNLQQGNSDTGVWQVGAMIDPANGKRICVVQSTPTEETRYHGHQIELSVSRSKAILTSSSLNLTLLDGSGIAVDRGPIFRFDRRKNDGALFINKRYEQLISELRSGNSTEIFFTIDDSKGLHKFTFDLIGFRDALGNLGDC